MAVILSVAKNPRILLGESGSIGEDETAGSVPPLYTNRKTALIAQNASPGILI
jgi:hypothetical protein